MGLKIGAEQESVTCWWRWRGGGEEEPELEQELRCLNVNELSDASRSCNLWTSATITANYSERQNLEERKRNAERWHTACVCVCALMTEGGGGGRD